ncbi:MAG: hypothetical protein NT166_08000 [Candidatus Aminicenantes bacterium]|nr:hypothetical protein [Candidatus Aminicenantes bacterium]
MIKKQDIKHKRLKKIVDDYNEIHSWLEKHKERLEILKKDYQLLTIDPPYKIHFAVDFHEIYRLVFPLGAESELKKIKDSEKDDWIHHKVVSQTGRICLFYGMETSLVPVLLPPYRDELEDFLFWLKSEYKKAVEQYRIIMELKESIKTALHDEGIEFKSQDLHFELLDENYAKIIDFIKKYFFQISFLLMGGYTDGFSILKSLFTDNRIDMVSNRWSEYLGFINDEIKKIPNAWFEFISKFRKRKTDSNERERNIERANSRDILALHLIKVLNKKFKEENKKEIVLLVSDAEIFKSLLNHTLDDDIKNSSIGGVIKTLTGEETTICRTTDIFHTYLLVKKEREELRERYKQKNSANAYTVVNSVILKNVEDDLRKMKLIEEFNREIDIVIDFCNKREHTCQNQDKCIKEDYCAKTEEVIKKFQEDRKSLESLELADKFGIFTKIYKRYEEISRMDEVVKQILKLLQEDKDVSEIINKKLEDIRIQINLGFEKLTESSIIQKPEPDVLRIPRGNSFRIRTYGKEVDEVIRKIQRSIRLNDQKLFSQYFADLKSKKKELDKSKSLKYLSSSLVAAAYENYDLALYFLETGLIFEATNMPLHREFKYLEAIIYSNKKKYEKALALCKDLLKNFQDDYRFPYFCGYIILTGKDENTLDGCSYDDAVGYCREALSLLKKAGDKDEDLNLYILNNLIYGLAKIGSLQSIEEAEQYITNLEGCSSAEDDWGFQICHTIGYVYLRKAEFLKRNNEDYSKIIDKAIYYFIIADHKAYGENMIINNDLKKAREL